MRRIVKITDYWWELPLLFCSPSENTLKCHIFHCKGCKRLYLLYRTRKSYSAHVDILLDARIWCVFD